MSLPPFAYELVAAPLAFVLAAAHARRALGTGRAAVELLALVAYGYLLERIAIGVFASHDYGSAWLLAPGGVPVAVAVTWAAVIVAAMALGARIARAAFGRAAAAALIGISLDLLMEPVAVRVGLWTWTPRGPWLEVPIGNFVGWAVIVGTYALGAEREGRPKALVGQALGRLALGAGAVAALLAVGVAWRGLGAEEAFRGGMGWAAWGMALLATGTLGRPPADLPTTAGQGSLASRLGATPGPRPALVFLVLVAVFAADALGTGDPALLLVALGSITALGAVLWRAST